MKINPGDTDRSSPDTGEVIRVALEQQLEEGQQARTNRQPPAIPDHTLLRRIGTGAYGEVFLARNALGTLRAVKVVYRDRFEDERPYQREFNGILKYEPISRTHEGLMAVLHVGCNDEAGYFYYIMELADSVKPLAGTNEPGKAAPGARNDDVGTNLEARKSELPASSSAPVPLSDPRGYAPRTLREELRHKTRLLPVEAAQFAVRVAGALAYLHAHGLVHRDVKPSNVIFIGGRPKLADIGLVTGAGDSRSFVGTEGFIPPEGPGAPQADLYGLGKLLYELVTGRDRLEFPQLPAGLAVDGDPLLELNEVVTRACAPDSHHRYATATEMLADLNLFLSGRSLREARKLKRHVFWLKRFSAAACLVLVLAGIAVWVARDAALRAHEREQQSHARALLELTLRQRAEAAERDSRQQLYSALLEEARGLVHSGELGQRVRALEAIRRAASISNAPALRSVAFAALALPDLRFTREVPVGPEATGAALEPSFGCFALCRGNGPVEIHSTSDGRLLATLTPSANLPTFGVRWSTDGRLLAVTRDSTTFGEKRNLEVWNVAARRQLALFTNVPWGAASFHPRLSQIVIGLPEGVIVTWDLQTAQEVTRFRLDGNATFIAHSPDGERLATAWVGKSGSSVSIHSATTGARLASWVLEDQVFCLDWHPSCRWVAAADFDGQIHLLDSKNGGAQSLGRHKAQAVLTAFSPDGDYLISGGWERELICWNLRTLDRAFTISLGSFAAQFRADGRECAIGTESGFRIYSFELPAHDREFAEELGGRVRHAAFSPDGRWLAASGKERLGVWDLAGHGPGAFVAEGADAYTIFFSPDSSQLYVGREDECFRWRVTPGTAVTESPRLEPLTIQKPEGFTSICLASNAVIFTGTHGSKFAATDSSSEIRDAWSKTSDGFSGVSLDGRWLAIFHPFTSWLHVYRLPDFEPVATLNNGANIGGFEFSPTGDEVVVTSARRLDFWSTTTWQRSREVINFMHISFSHDPTSWWLTKDFQHGGLYDSRTLEALLPLPSGALPLALSPDGRYLALSIEARQVQVWDLKMVREEFRKLGIDWKSDP
jgi:WD40 repeat protein